MLTKNTKQCSIVKMRKCLTKCFKFSRILQCGAAQKCVNLVDLVKCFQTSSFFAEVGVDTAVNGPLKVGQKLEKTIHQN